MSQLIDEVSMMGNFEVVKVLINQTAGSQHHLTVNTIFVSFMGELEGGVFLSQLIYWSDRGQRNDGWFYKTLEEWYKEIGLKRRAINRCTRELERRGIIQSKIMKAAGTPKTHYRLDMEKLAEQLAEFLKRKSDGIAEINEMHESTNGNEQTDKSEMHESTNGNVRKAISSITENTTKNTTKNVVFNEIDIHKKIIDYLNQKTKKRYKYESKGNQKYINGRLSEGYDFDDFKQVIDIKVKEWNGTKVEQYLRPSTLFNSEKFEAYLNQDTRIIKEKEEDSSVKYDYGF